MYVYINFDIDVDICVNFDIDVCLYKF